MIGPEKKLEIEKKDVEVVKDYQELNRLAESGNELVVVRNKEKPGEIRLVGRLCKKEDKIYVEGLEFERVKKGSHHIVGKGYDRTSKAKYGNLDEKSFSEYGINSNEFEPRHPVIVKSPRKQEIISELEELSKIPFSIFNSRTRR